MRVQLRILSHEGYICDSETRVTFPGHSTNKKFWAELMKPTFHPVMRTHEALL
jgi:hypothetical protein